MSPLGITLPKSLSNPFGANGGIIDLVAAIVIILTALLLSRGMSEAARIENILVILKVLAIVLFVIVGLTMFHLFQSIKSLQLVILVDGKVFMQVYQ